MGLLGATRKGLSFSSLGCPECVGNLCHGQSQTSAWTLSPTVQQLCLSLVPTPYLCALKPDLGPSTMLLNPWGHLPMPLYPSLVSFILVLPSYPSSQSGQEHLRLKTYCPKSTCYFPKSVPEPCNLPPHT